MELLDKNRIRGHIVGKLDAYKKRRDKAKSEGKTQEMGDYTLRIMVLDNLLLRIERGEFNVYTVKDIVSKDEQIGENNAG